jgi:Xaa-Pro dipeptidase
LRTRRATLCRVTTHHRDEAASATPDRADEVGTRLEWLRAAAAARSAAGVLVRSRASFAWATLGGLNYVVAGSESGAVPLLVTGDGAWALAPVNEAARIADEETAGLPVEVRSVPWEVPGAAEAEASRIAGGRVLAEAELGDDLIARRSVLMPGEHEELRAIARDVSTALEATCGGVRPGITEAAAAGELAAALMARGVRAPVLLAAADERIDRYRHPIPTDRPVVRRLMLVAVGERRGLHAAATRFVELERPSADMEARMAATQDVLDAMQAASRPGVTLGDVLDAARAAYDETGFGGEWRLHHQGGTIGYAPRERIATPGDRTELAAGMAVAWNPSITGTKLEATFLVARSGAEQLGG